MDDAQHLGVQRSVRRDEVPCRGVKRRAVHAGNAAARLFHNEHTGTDVPGFEVLLPERLETTRRDVTEIKRRRSQSSHSSSLQEELSKDLEQIAYAALGAGRKA